MKAGVGPALIHIRRARLHRTRRFIDCRGIMGSRLAFIGLGIMGRPMAGHLLAGGHELVVQTRTPAKAAELVERGAKLVDSAADAALQAEVVFVCVPDTP